MNASPRPLSGAVSLLLALWFANAFAPAVAQVPDTTDAARYFPMHPGDVWVYEVQRWDLPRVYEVRTIGRDGEGGGASRLTALQVDEQGHPITSPSETSLRFNLHKAELMPAAHPQPPPPLGVLLFCSFAAPFGGALTCPCGDGGAVNTVTVTGGYGQTVTVGDDAVVTSVKRYDTQGCEVATRFAAGIGIVGYEMRGGTSRLVHARVGGASYGQPPAWLSASAEAASVAAPTVSPNPARGRARFAFTLAAPHDVQLALYDMLGREAAVLLNGRLEAGLHRAVYDGAGLSSGTYLWRLTIGDAVQSGRVTLLR